MRNTDFIFCVFRTDVSYHDMELLDQMQSIPDIERWSSDFLPLLNDTPKSLVFDLYLLSSVAALYVVCLVLTSHNQKEEFC